MAMLGKKLLLILIFAISFGLYSQVQTIRGTVKDKESHQPLGGVDIRVVTPGIDSGKRALTDANGDFVIQNIGIGRRDLSVSLKGYKALMLNNIIVSSAKEVILQVEMEEEAQLIGEINIRAKTRQGEPNNENALVSARQFTVDETDRFAGSRGDPARMASNFAGVQGADDSRNDIVVRGNSPQGILWRLEGIDIPNPNHFAIPGTTGGPVSIINNKILSNSDFFTGAFPAEYGNSTAGVFDLRMRNGNNRKREYSSQLGFLGWDLLAEGPFSKKSKASYMFTYRYSTLALFSALKIPIGTDAVPHYQDVSFKLNFPLKNKANLSFFGIGGASNINILISQQKESSTNLYGDNDRDQRFASKMGVVGSSYTKTVGRNSYFKITIAASTQIVSAKHTLVFRHVTDTFNRKNETFYRFQLDSLVPNLDYVFRTSTLGVNLFMNHKLSPKTNLKYGIQITRYGYSFKDSARNFDFLDTAHYWKWYTRWNSTGFGLLLQPYVQAKWKLGSLWQLSAGLTSQIFTISDNKSGIKHTSVEAIQPRMGLRYQVDKRSSINLGMGMHSQIQPGYTYFYMLPGNSKPHNMNMGMTRSNHLVLGYDRNLGKDMRLKFETYYQQLSHIPVGIKPSSFSLANTGSGFSRFFPDTLQNTGIGHNYGVELTLEKFFTKGYYYLVTMSVFDAKYRGSDGVWRNSDFNTKYALNALIAKEWKVSKRGVLNFGGKITAAGARRYSPMDTLATLRQREYVEVGSQKNTLTFGSPYRRLDIRVSYKINTKKLTHEFAIDLINVTGRKNILKYSYISEPPYAHQTYQLGFLPLFYYKLDF